MVFTPQKPDGRVGLFYHTDSGLDEPVEPDLSRVVQHARHCRCSRTGLYHQLRLDAGTGAGGD